MKNELLPIGTVIKTKKGKIGIITGYFGGTYGNFGSAYGSSYHTFDYQISPFPFDTIHVENDFKSLKKYEWYDYKLGGLFEKDIDEIIFIGYKDETFEEIKNRLVD